MGTDEMHAAQSALTSVGRRHPRIGCDVWAWITAFAVVASGCGRGSNLVPVRGIVQHDDRAVTEGNVLLTPLGEGKPAFGQIQPDGTFQLTTHSLNDGAAVGQYSVSVAAQRNLETGRTGRPWVGPPSLTLEVLEGKENEFRINIREKDGWRRR